MAALISLVLGAAVAGDLAARMVDERSRAGAEDLQPLVAGSLGQAYAFLESPTPVAGFPTPSRDRPAKICSGADCTDCCAACGPICAGGRCEKFGGPEGWLGVGAGGLALALG